jgi:hypothetical protein
MASPETGMAGAGMLMVIIGAGASYDSSPDKPARAGEIHINRPPLADNLFLDVGLLRKARAEFPLIHALIPELLPNTRQSLEQSLQKLQGEAATNSRRHRQLLAIRYYLQTVFSTLTPQWLRDIGGVTNYQALLGQIDHHRRNYRGPICLVTFNYDTLIESALSIDFGMNFAVPDDYICGTEFKLFKLHGSENWGRHLQGQIPTKLVSGRGSGPWGDQTEMINHAVQLQTCISDKFSIVGVPGPRHAGPPLYPAIAIPVLDKSEFECPGPHVEMLRSLIPKVTKLLTIGWRASEQHFIKMLRSLTSVDIVTVAGTEAESQEILDRIRLLGMGVRIADAYEGFSQCVAERRFDQLLST